MKTKYLSLMVAGALFLVLAGFASQSDARVNVGVNINIPGFTFAAPPVMAVIPGTYVYFAPDANIDILFYDGYWYRPYEGRWFRSRGYDGPWHHIRRSWVPGALIELPPDYRHIYREYPRRDYREFHRNWRDWQRNRYWDRDRMWREGRGRGRHEERREERREHMR